MSVNLPLRSGTDIARQLLLAALAVGSLFACPATGHCFYRYAIFDVENRSDVTMTYQLRWNNGDWKEFTVVPGDGILHSTEITTGGNAALPRPAIKFLPGGNLLEPPRIYDVVATASPQRTGYSNGYFFVDKKEGKKQFVDLIRRTPTEDQAEGHFVRGRQLEGSGDHANAVRQLNRALQLDPKATAALVIRGRCLSSIGDHDSALDDFNEVIRRYPRTPNIYRDRGGIFFNKSRYVQAIEDFDRALALEPTDNLCLQMRGTAHLRMRNFDQAIADFARAQKAEPKSALSLRNLGATYYVKGDVRSAINYFDRAIALDPTRGWAFLLRGRAHGKIGNADKAREDAEQAQRLKANPQEIYLQPFDEALAALDVYEYGKSLTPELLEKSNVLEDGVEPVKRSKAVGSGPVPDPVKRLIRAEWSRFKSVKFDAVAAANLFFTAAMMSPQKRAAEGMELEWLFGPASSPIARQASNDDLGGLRIVGSLTLKDGKFINMIFARGYVPPDAERETRGGIAFLEGGDNARLVARVNNTGDVAKDFLFQSFSIENPNKDAWSMRPGYALDETTGTLMSDKITESALSGRCMHCHSGGSNLNAKVRADNAQKEAIEFYLGIAKTYGASYDSRGKGEKREVEILREKMTKVGPLAVLPIEPLYQANRRYWAEIYPELLERQQTRTVEKLAGEVRGPKKK
jgi:tetratricopeptide (TPR) repeat protein